MKINKKGFTLAELLIVIAIIAILIAIAIPVFGAQLDNARRQTDHANMRSAYTIAQIGSLQGGLYIGVDETWTAQSDSDDYTFNADGTIGDGGTAYVLKAGTDSDSCASSPVCSGGETHAAGSTIHIKWDKDNGKYIVVLVPESGS